MAEPQANDQVQTATEQAPLLSIRDLRLSYRTERGDVRAVDGMDLDIYPNEAIVLLGESGCGKTSMTKALLRMLPRNVGRFDGEVWLDGRDLMKLSDEAFRREVRWVQISMVMQAAMNAMNPVVRVGDQVAEPLRVHKKFSKAQAYGESRRDFPFGWSADRFFEPLPF
jgi:peptide/nickel transport system ATP-binding protein